MKKLILLSVLLIVGCAHKPPQATFYLGMTEEEFIELNQNKPIMESPVTEKYSYNNIKQYIDGNSPNSMNTYWYSFHNDTLRQVNKGIHNLMLNRDIDYDKYATPPE